MKRVAILGCGPAGLMAAWAAHQLGHEVYIFSKAQKSTVAGAQYLHNRVLGITPEEFDLEVDFIKFGTREEYARKAYGTPNPEKCSWDNFPAGLVQGWSLRTAYDALWEIFRLEIVETRIDPGFVQRLLKRGMLVISTIPAQFICKNSSHLFVSEHHWIVEAHELVVPKDTIIYNGYTPEYASEGPVDFGADDQPESQVLNWWHRGSNLDNRTFLESRMHHARGIQVTKPQSTTCDCFGSRVMRVGRYGRWERDVLADSAYWDVRDALS